MAERKPVVLVGGQLKELPAGDTLPAQAPATHSHLTSDVTGLDAALNAKLSDAPSDGKQYARKDATWTEVVAGGGGGTPTLVHTTTTTQTAIPGQHYSLENAAATTVTLPASPIDGDVVWVTVNNGRTDNVLARNGQQIMGVAEDMTLDVVMTYQLRFIGTSWRLL
jgi:hypothetical protein